MRGHCRTTNNTNYATLCPEEAPRSAAADASVRAVANADTRRPVEMAVRSRTPRAGGLERDILAKARFSLKSELQMPIYECMRDNRMNLDSYNPHSGGRRNLDAVVAPVGNVDEPAEAETRTLAHRSHDADIAGAGRPRAARSSRTEALTPERSAEIRQRLMQGAYDSPTIIEHIARGISISGDLGYMCPPTGRNARAASTGNEGRSMRAQVISRPFNLSP